MSRLTDPIWQVCPPVKQGFFFSWPSLNYKKVEELEYLSQVGREAAYPQDDMV